MSEEPPALATFPLVVQPPMVRGWVFAAGTLFVMICGAVIVGIPAAFCLGPVPGIAGAGLGAGLALWQMLRTRRETTAPVQPPPLRVEASGLRVPSISRLTQTYRPQLEVWIPYEKLGTVAAYGWGEPRGIVIRARGLRGPHLFPRGLFADAEAPERFLSETRKAIQAHDPELLRRLEQRPGVQLGPP